MSAAIDSRVPRINGKPLRADTVYRFVWAAILGYWIALAVLIVFVARGVGLLPVCAAFIAVTGAWVGSHVLKDMHLNLMNLDRPVPTVNSDDDWEQGKS